LDKKISNLDKNVSKEIKFLIEAKCHSIDQKYNYLDHTEDVQLQTWGETLEEAFEQGTMAMFGHMTGTGTVESLQTVEVETQGDDL
jgi:hypothetical protein